MSFSPQSNYSQYGFEEEEAQPVDKQPENSALVASPQTQPNPNIPENAQQPNYADYGFEPEKHKAGKGESVLWGLAEAFLGIPGLIQYGVNEYSKGLEKAFTGEVTQLPFEQENPILNISSKFPESKDEASRRLRVGTTGAVMGIPFGIPGIIAGLVGSQAGQTVREMYGNEGKFDEFGWGEAGAIGADIIGGGLAGAGASLARGATRGAANQAARVPAIFENPQTGLQRAIVKNSIQGERNALQTTINNFAEGQLRGFEQEATAISPDRYTDLIHSDASALRQHADNMFRNTQLSIISPIAATPEQGGTALQQAANAVFQQEVIGAERAAYNQAREAAQGIAGTAPRTLEQAKALRNELTKNTPTPEQVPLINFLDGLISDLETTTPGSVTPASRILDSSGNPVSQAVENAPTSTPTRRSANDLVDRVQRANEAVNYDAELRYQSHRLKPIVNTLREEVGTVLAKKPEAARLYQEANTLHGENAETWGTKFMRNLRFGENPEQNIGKMKLASNMRNFKQGVNDPALQALAERLVISNITEGGSAQSNRAAVGNLAPELSPNARNAAQQLVEGKDPLSTAGGRAAVRNDILKDAAQSVSSGRRPDRILDIMQTPKGYNLVRESLNASPNSRRLFQSFERLFVEDIFSSITDKNGVIDFAKARNIIKNNDVRDVLNSIGGDTLVRRFRQLETFADNLERNVSVYKSPETQTFFQQLAKNTKSAGIVGAILHSLHVPLPVIAGLGIGKGLLSGGKITYDALKSQLLSNPRAVRILESISIASTTEELMKQVPRLITEIEKMNAGDQEK